MRTLYYSSLMKDTKRIRVHMSFSPDFQKTLISLRQILLSKNIKMSHWYRQQVEKYVSKHEGR